MRRDAEVALRKAGIGTAIGFFLPILFFALFSACFTWFAGPWLFHLFVDPYGVPPRVKTQFTVWGVVTGTLGLALGVALQCIILNFFWGWQMFGAMGATGALVMLFCV